LGKPVGNISPKIVKSKTVCIYKENRVDAIKHEKDIGLSMADWERNNQNAMPLKVMFDFFQMFEKVE
jgi:hypothetical protein